MNKIYEDRLKAESIIEALGTSKEIFDKVAEEILTLVRSTAGTEGINSMAELYHAIGNIINRHVFDETEERKLSEFEMLMIHMAFKSGEVWKKVLMMEQMQASGGPLSMISKLLDKYSDKSDDCSGDSDSYDND